MNVQTRQRTRAEAALIQQFDGGSATPRRRAAFERFAASGLPTRRVESWHYTDLRAAMADAAPLAGAPDSGVLEKARALLADRRRIGAGRVVLVNGRYAESLSDRLPVAMTVEAEPTWPAAADDAMVALNEAMVGEAYRFDIPDGKALNEPIEIVHVAVGDGPEALYARVAIAAGAGARASFVEAFVGGTPQTQRNVATSLVLGKGASLRHVVSIEDDASLHVESLVGRLAAGAEFNDFGLVKGGALVAAPALPGSGGGGREGRARRSLACRRRSPRGHDAAGDAFRAGRHEPRILPLDHRRRGRAGRSRARSSSPSSRRRPTARMKSQAVLLSPTAQMNAKPELEIFADDVVCGHGATVASLDPEQLFYLEARGIPKAEAEAMLLEAFGEEAIERVEDEALAEALRGEFRAWLHADRAGRKTPAEATS